jgi:hypothetical protein
MRILLFLCGALLSALALASPPQRVQAVYEATRNGQPFATVTETYFQEGTRYRIESITKGIGVYALFGTRRLASEGEVTPDGLRPARFELQQGDRRPQRATFDWTTGKLTMESKKTSSADLLPGTQDLASFPYQFMFRPPTGDEVEMPVTTGKKLRTYHYRVAGRDERMESALGELRVVRLVNDAPEANDEKELWLASDKHHIPARIVTRDENGARIEQVLTSLSIE